MYYISKLYIQNINHRVENKFYSQMDVNLSIYV